MRYGAGPLEDEEDQVAARVAPMMANSSSTARSSRKRASDSNLDALFAEEEDDSPPPRRRNVSSAAAAQVDGVHDDHSSGELIDVKPSVADLNITPIIQPRKRISIAGGDPDSHRLAKRTKPLGRSMQ